MEAPHRITLALAAVGLVAALVVPAAPVAADMHGACDTQNDDAEGFFGPAGYANVALFQNVTDAGFTYGGGVYCPGAVVTINEVTVTDLESDDVVASTSASACTSSPFQGCTTSSGIKALDPGTYEVLMLFDADDPNTDGLEYEDVPRRQEFTWLGAGQPVLTCPDAGWVHANPPACP